MKEKPIEKIEQETEATSKKDWHDPKLTFVKPKLTKHGGVKEVTGGFFGTFTP